MASFITRLFRGGRVKFSPIVFPISGFETVCASEKLEEEFLPEFSTGRFYPVNIGENFASRYQVVGKLGLGTTSTVWLARDLQAHQHVALKVYTRGQSSEDEFGMYQYLKTCPTAHPGFRYIRTALDVFTIQRQGGGHQCVVQKPLWESFRDFLSRNPTHRFTEELLRAGLRSMLLALDYLHTECHIVHTDIKADNILLAIEDRTVLNEFVQAEQRAPSPRKFVNGTPIYASRLLGLPHTFGDPILSDFGSAVRGHVEHTEDVQPNIYRAPDVMLKAKWSYPIDIWNLGCMIWDLFEDKHLFTGKDANITDDFDPNGDGYTTRAHLAEVVGMLGHPPVDLLRRGTRSRDFFTEEGQWCADADIAEDASLEKSEENLEGENKKQF